VGIQMIDQSSLKKNFAWLSKTMGFALFMAVAPVSQAALDSVIIDLDQPPPGDTTRGSKYLVELIEVNGTTWTYTFQPTTSQDQIDDPDKGKASYDISHQDLDLGACLDHIDLDATSAANSGDIEIPTNGDPSAGNFEGLKWEGEGGGTFNLVMDAVYPTGIIEVLIKANIYWGTGLISGPNCIDIPDDFQCPPETDLIGEFEWDETGFIPDEVAGSGGIEISEDATQSGGDWISQINSNYVKAIVMLHVKEGPPPEEVVGEQSVADPHSGAFDNTPIGGLPIQRIKFCGDNDSVLVKDVSMNVDGDKLSWTASEEDNVKFRVWQLMGEVNSKADNWGSASYDGSELLAPANSAFVLQAIDSSGKNTFHTLGADGNVYTYELVPVNK
jgi:hypothetical protein